MSDFSFAWQNGVKFQPRVLTSKSQKKLGLATPFLTGLYRKFAAFQYLTIFHSRYRSLKLNDAMDKSHHHRHSNHRRDHERQRDGRSESPNLASATHSGAQGRTSIDRSHRERSPRTHHRKRRHSPHAKAEDEEILLPHNARKLVKSDLAGFRPLLGLYLDIQKGKDIEGMEEEEVKGRWKSFLGKW